MAVEVYFTSGVRSLTATTNVNQTVVKSQDSGDKPCTMERMFRLVDFTLTVPKNPPPMASRSTLLVSVAHAGKQNQETLYYPTGKAWNGTVHSTATMKYHAMGSYTGTYDGKLVLNEDSQGAITGHGHVAASGCELPPCSNCRPPATFIDFDVTGTDNGKRLELQIVPSSFRLDGNTCGFGIGFGDRPGLERTATPKSAIIPITTSGIAEGPWFGRWVWTTAAGTDVNTADYKFALTCTDCQESH